MIESLDLEGFKAVGFWFDGRFYPMTILPGEAPVPEDWRAYEDDEFMDYDEEDDE